MRLAAILTTFSYAAATLAARQCGSHPDAATIARAEAGFKPRPGGTAVAPGSQTIDVHWHVISKNETKDGGDIPDVDIDEQIRVLNDDFAKTPYIFELQNVNRVWNETWFDYAHPNSTEGRLIASEMKSHLREGGPATLNIYTVGFTELGGALLGYATFPWMLQQDPLSEDGVVLLYSTLPNGTNTPYNLGRTATHEIGHWVGLYHTFQGESCTGEGDYVDDTPFQSVATDGCPIGKDTCPEEEGNDPIDNFMDYSDDACMHLFSQGQVDRMTGQMQQYRKI